MLEWHKEIKIIHIYNEISKMKAVTFKAVSSSRITISIISFSFIFLFLSLVSGTPYQECSVYGNCKVIKPTTSQTNFSSVNVNNSQYLQGYTPSTLYNHYKILFDLIYQPIGDYLTTWLVPDVTNGYLYNDSTKIYFNESKITEKFIPYTGAVNNVDLNSKNLITTGTVNATKFNGLFNFTTLDNWNSFNGATLLFNETKLNNTILDLGISLGFNSTYNATYNTWAYNQTIPTFNYFYNKTSNVDLGSYNLTTTGIITTTYLNSSGNSTIAGANFWNNETSFFIQW